MPRTRSHIERHAVARIGWLRAAVLGANDGILSTASLLVGVATASATRGGILVTGLAGLVAGAMSMAAGEYVSVSSQADSEKADLDREGEELSDRPDEELAELTAIYVQRGLSPELARQVAQQMHANGALVAHARDELGLTEHLTAKPIQAALTSAATFASGAALPLAAAAAAPARAIVPVVTVASLLFLALLGAVGARTGGSPMGKAIVRVAFWGALAMAATAGLGRLFNAPI